MQDRLSRILYFTVKDRERDLNTTAAAANSSTGVKDQRVLEQEQAMRESETREKKIDCLLKTKDIMQRELLLDVQFYAFLTAYMNLKMKNVEEELQ